MLLLPLNSCGAASPEVALSRPESCQVSPMPQPPEVHPFQCPSDPGKPPLVCLTLDDAVAIGKWGQEIADFYVALQDCPALQFRVVSSIRRDIRTPSALRGEALLRRIGGS